MKIEKICEYFNDIGILEIKNIDTFLRIYSQLNAKRFRNKMDQLKLALFSYMKTVFKNDSHLYTLSKNVVDGFSNNRVVQEYRSLYMINNIFQTKLILRYADVFNKINKFAFRNQKKKIQTRKLNNTKNTFSISDREVNSYDNIKVQNSSSLQNKTKKSHHEKYNLKNFNTSNYNENNTYLIEGLTWDDIDNCTFTPKINKNYNANKHKNKVTNFNNDYNNIESNKRYKNTNFIPYDSSNNSNILNNMNNSVNNNDSKIHPFKNYYNYGNNNKIKNEIEKLLYNLNMYRGDSNNASSNKKKIKKKNNDNIMINDELNYEMTDDNSLFDNYDFYKSQKDHVERVNNKIKNLQLEKMNKISQECTFFPKTNKFPKYSKFNDDINICYQNNFHKLKNDTVTYNNENLNKSYNNKNIYKNINSVKKAYYDDYYNIYPELSTSKSKKRSRSDNTKKNDETSIYKMRQKELENYYNKKYPFIPNITNSEKYKINTTFEERQKKYLEDKAKIQKQKEEDEKKEVDELKKRYMEVCANTNSKEVVGRLYDKEAKIIKEKIKLEKEKNKKKVIIDWDQRNKENNCKYTDGKNYNKNNKSPSTKKHLSKKVEQIVERLANDSKNKNKNKKILNDEKKQQIKDFGDFNQSKKNNNIENKKQKLMNKIKDEHNIGFKNGGNLNNFNDVNENIKKVNGNEILNTNNEEESTNIMNIEEKINANNYNGNLLDNFSNKVGIKSKAFQEMLNKYHDK